MQVEQEAVVTMVDPERGKMVALVVAVVLMVDMEELGTKGIMEEITTVQTPGLVEVGLELQQQMVQAIMELMVE